MTKARGRVKERGASPPVPAGASVPAAAVLEFPPSGTPEPVARHCRDLCARVPWLIASDGWLLLELAQLLADVEEARKQVQAGGAMVLTKTGELRENPWAERERKLRDQLVRLAAQYGLTPVARRANVSGVPG